MFVCVSASVFSRLLMWCLVAYMNHPHLCTHTRPPPPPPTHTHNRRRATAYELRAASKLYLGLAVPGKDLKEVTSEHPPPDERETKRRKRIPEPCSKSR